MHPHRTRPARPSRVRARYRTTTASPQAAIITPLEDAELAFNVLQWFGTVVVDFRTAATARMRESVLLADDAGAVAALPHMKDDAICLPDGSGSYSAAHADALVRAVAARVRRTLYVLAPQALAELSAAHPYLLSSADGGKGRSATVERDHRVSIIVRPPPFFLRASEHCLLIGCCLLARGGSRAHAALVRCRGTSLGMCVAVVACPCTAPCVLSGVRRLGACVGVKKTCVNLLHESAEAMSATLRSSARLLAIPLLTTCASCLDVGLLTARSVSDLHQARFNEAGHVVVRRCVANTDCAEKLHVAVVAAATRVLDSQACRICASSAEAGAVAMAPRIDSLEWGGVSLNVGDVLVARLPTLERLPSSQTMLMLCVLQCTADDPAAAWVDTLHAARGISPTSVTQWSKGTLF